MRNFIYIVGREIESGYIFDFRSKSIAEIEYYFNTHEKWDLSYIVLQDIIVGGNTYNIRNKKVSEIMDLIHNILNGIEDNYILNSNISNYKELLAA